MNDNEPILVFDLETQTYGKPDSKKDKFKLCGCYSYLTNKYYMLNEIEQVNTIISKHKYIVGFNIKDYDNPILSRYKVNLKYKVIIDLMEIFKNRAGQIKIEKGMLKDILMKYSLDYITKTLDLVDDESGKKEIDYSVFQKEHWTAEETKEIADYCKRDIEVTKKLYEWVELYFKDFKDFISNKNIENKSYLTSTTAVLAYKAICHALHLPENYSSEVRDESFGGGYVAFPAGESFHDNILLFDYSSLYPNLFIQANLFGNECKCCDITEKWHGDNFFKVKGFYCTKKISPLGQLFKDFFIKRKELKKNNDTKEYSIKIIINSSYGAISNPVFDSIYNLTSAEDCTSLGRQFIKYTRKRFKEEGFLNIMTDTDSVAIQLPEGKTKEDAIKLSEKIVEELQSHLPFPW